MPDKQRIAVFVSGGGTNLQAIIDAAAAGKLPHGELALVLSSKPGVYALTRAEQAGIPTAVVSRRESGSQAAFEAAILEKLEASGGRLKLSDDSDPEEIRRILGISKNAFKRAAGRLLKQGKIGMADGEIYRKNA